MLCAGELGESAMRLRVATELPCSAERAWELVRKWSTLQFIAWPLVRIGPTPGGTLPDWRQGDETLCRSALFGLVPIGTRRVRFDTLDAGTGTIQTQESDVMVRSWRHQIRITPIDAGHCAYSDTVEIEAGLLTVPVWIWAHWFYRHRQRRWRKLLAG